MPDRVRCIDNKRVQKKLTIGKEYEVKYESDGLYVSSSTFAPAYNVCCDDGVERWYAKDRFEPVAAEKPAS